MTQVDTTAPTVIVGGGLGGLSAAIHLAAAGQKVVLLEKNQQVGGKANLHVANGYTFDTGPSLLTMPWVLRDICAVAGVRFEDYFNLVPLESSCRYFWPDGTRFEAYQSLPLLTQEITRIEPNDVGGFLRFLAYTRGIYEAVAEPFLYNPPDQFSDLIGPQLVKQSLKIDSLRSVDQSVRSFFRSPYLRQLFNRYATYNGSSPYRSPATFNVIPYVELLGGAWHIKGGIYELVRALERIALRLGVTIRTNAEVAEICVQAGQTRGVRLADGTEFPASQVVSNADPRYVYQKLLPTQRATAQRLTQLELSCSGFVLLLGIDRVYEELAHHTIFFSANYPAEFAAIFDKKVPAPDPTIYICTTSITDPEHAPPGHMNWFVLINAPSTNPRVNWQREAAPYAEVVVRKLERLGLDNLRQHIRYQQIITPDDLAARYHAPGGAIYGLASNTPWTAFLRPPLRARDVRGLYFAGGGTHPGGGIPLVLLSGRAAAQRVLKDQGLAVR
jgi:phytoene desaturase